MPPKSERQHCWQRTVHHQLLALSQQEASFCIQRDRAPPSVLSPCVTPHKKHSCPVKLVRQLSQHRLPSHWAASYTSMSTEPTRGETARVTAWLGWTLATWRSRQNAVPRSYYLLLALRGITTARPDRSPLAYVFYLPSHTHCRLAAVSFGACFFSRYLNCMIFFLLLRTYKKNSIERRLFRWETIKSSPLMVCYFTSNPPGITSGHTRCY